MAVLLRRNVEDLSLKRFIMSAMFKNIFKFGGNPFNRKRSYAFLTRRLMMDYRKLREEKLREAASLGDVETLKDLISSGVDVNSKNSMNGWTALHWAAVRGNEEAVRILLQNGADKASKTNSCDTPCCLASTDEVRLLLGGCEHSCERKELPIVPNYLQNPPLNCSKLDQNKTPLASNSGQQSKKELILRIELLDSTFVEVEVPPSALTFKGLKRICAEVLEVEPKIITKVLKLPNTLIRNDSDVLRLKELDEIQCFIKWRGPLYDPDYF